MGFEKSQNIEISVSIILFSKVLVTKYIKSFNWVKKSQKNKIQIYINLLIRTWVTEAEILIGFDNP